MTLSDQPSPLDAAPLRYSVVVPVYNEAEGIAEFCRVAREHLPDAYELLLCYDRDDDTTLPVLAALPEGSKPTHIRTVRNRFGRGAGTAIRSGMLAARAPVVLVTMADLADDFTHVEQMIRRAEGGVDVVCGSRYMPGGRQIGGPWLKSLLSRIAGISLYRVAGVPTHDATNSFKAYRADFLKAVPIDSTAGFVLGLELTVKAHFLGYCVDEVPAIWHDRTTGQSRFRLVQWLPTYLQWYFWAFARAFGPGRQKRKIRPVTHRTATRT